MISGKSYSKIIEGIHEALRSAFELTHLFENYSLSLSGKSLTVDVYIFIDVVFLESTDLPIISKMILFNFFKCTIHYGPNFAFSVCVILIIIFSMSFFLLSR